LHDPSEPAFLSRCAWVAMPTTTGRHRSNGRRRRMLAAGIGGIGIVGIILLVLAVLAILYFVRGRA